MSVAQGTPPDLPGYCARTFTLMPVGSTSQRSVQVSGFADICLLTPLRRLYPLPVRQASALPSASSRFAVTRDTLAVQLTLLLAECVEDFHLQVRAPCRAHDKKSPAHREGLRRLAGLLVAAAGPVEARFAVLAVDQAGVHRCGERRVVDPDGEIVAVCLGLALPRSPDLGVMRRTA